MGIFNVLFVEVGTETRNVPVQGGAAGTWAELWTWGYPGPAPWAGSLRGSLAPSAAPWPALGRLGKVLGAFTTPPAKPFPQGPSVAESIPAPQNAPDLFHRTAAQFDVNEHHFSCSYAFPANTDWGHWL